MSQPSLASPGVEAKKQKQPLNIYTVMLVISFINIVMACIVLYLVLGRWGSRNEWFNAKSAEPKAAWLVPAQWESVSRLA